MLDILLKSLDMFVIRGSVVSVRESEVQTASCHKVVAAHSRFLLFAVVCLSLIPTLKSYDLSNGERISGDAVALSGTGVTLGEPW